jgi:hypothetical protein
VDDGHTADSDLRDLNRREAELPVLPRVLREAARLVLQHRADGVGGVDERAHAGGSPR